MPFQLSYKLPYRRRDCSKREYHVVLGSDGKVYLRKSSPWCTQIQTQLGVTGYPWSDFVLFTRKEPCLTIERIYFHKNKFEKSVTKAMVFYDKFVYSKLLDMHSSVSTQES